MKDISVLIVYNALIAPIGNTRYLFAMVNDFLRQAGKNPLFKVKLVGAERELKLDNGLYTVQADATLEEVKGTSLIIIPPMSGDMERDIALNRKYISWIHEQYLKGSEVASLCVGAFLLAETGLLKNRNCSTHWKVANEFRKRFPEVMLVDDQVITDHDGLYTSGGANSYWNLLVYLVEKFTDRETAIHASKYFEIERDRNNQYVFRIFEGSKLHDDEAVHAIQQHIETHYQKRYTIAQLAATVCLSERTFQRRFKEATHFTVSSYIQKVRVEAAKRMLETGQLTINEVMFDVGYNDPKAFRAMFKKETGSSPLGYRTKFL